MTRTVLFIAATIVILAGMFLIPAMSPTCKPGDRGLYIGGVLQGRCPDNGDSSLRIR